MDLRTKRGPTYSKYDREIEIWKGRYQIQRRRKGGAGARRAAKAVRAKRREKR